MVEGGVDAGAGDEGGADGGESALWAEGGGVEFHPIAGGEDDGFDEAVDGAEAGEEAGQLGLADGKSLADVDVGDVVVETDAEEVHDCALTERAWITGSVTSAAVKTATERTATRLGARWFAWRTRRMRP
jgi:hypothetical protein